MLRGNVGSKITTAMASEGIPLASSVSEKADSKEDAEVSTGTETSKGNGSNSGNGVYIQRTINHSTSLVLRTCMIANCQLRPPTCQVVEWGTQWWRSVPTAED